MSEWEWGFGEVGPYLVGNRAFLFEGFTQVFLFSDRDVSDQADLFLSRDIPVYVSLLNWGCPL